MLDGREHAVQEFSLPDLELMEECESSSEWATSIFSDDEDARRTFNCRSELRGKQRTSSLFAMEQLNSQFLSALKAGGVILEDDDGNSALFCHKFPSPDNKARVPTRQEMLQMHQMHRMKQKAHQKVRARQLRCDSREMKRRVNGTGTESESMIGARTACWHGSRISPSQLERTEEEKEEGTAHTTPANLRNQDIQWVPQKGANGQPLARAEYGRLMKGAKSIECSR